MTYATGGPIQALDYNTFATLTGGMNQVYSDLYPNTVPTTLGTFNPDDPCTFGYGVTPSLATVLVGATVKASEWAGLFDTMRATGVHQGTTVSPPLPGADPIVGSTITAFNTPTTLAGVLSSLNTNRFNLAAGQSTLTAGTPQVQTSGTWNAQLMFSCQVDFGSWDNARYFFNTGGNLSFAGSYSPVSTPEDASWSALLTDMSAPTVLNYNSTTNVNGGGAPLTGFYGLTNSYKTIYHQAPISGVYTVNSLNISAKFANAGTSGKIDLLFELIDGEAIQHPKSGLTTFYINSLRSSGAVVIANPLVINPVFVSTT